MRSSAPGRPSLAQRLGAYPQSIAYRVERYADVAVRSTFASMQTFTYAVPPHMTIRPGSAVYVPFGKMTLQGVVTRITSTPSFADQDRIRSVHSTAGLTLDEDRLRIAEWIAHEYIAPVFESIALFLSPGFERKPQTIVQSLTDARAWESLNLTSRQLEVLKVVAEKAPLTLESLKKALAIPPEHVLASLEKRGLIVREYTLTRPSVGPKSMRVATLAVSADMARSCIRENEQPKLSRRARLLQRLVERRVMQASAAAALAGSHANLRRLARTGIIDLVNEDVRLNISAQEAHAEIMRLTTTRRSQQALNAVALLTREFEIDVPTLRRAAGVDTATLNWLAALGVLRLSERPLQRDPLADFHVVRRPPATLLPAQAAAAKAIADAVAGHRHETFLLRGVTGSGKTEVYLEALARCVADGRKAIVLVPEIALTPQTIRRFRERFERVAILHSGLSDGERFDQWHGIADGGYDVVVGARSAIFAPQPDLGLIVIDEEHEWTYKQQAPQPRYHARDVAIELARRLGAVVVLGSATPDVVSYKRASQGEYTMLTLDERVRPTTNSDGSTRPKSSTAMPRVDVVDLREELHDGNRSMFSADLQAAIATALEREEQIILFLNRRGMAGHVQCRDCGFVPECGSCDLALTYHRQYDRLVCHICNKRWKLPSTCRQCRSPRLKLLGVGIEKVAAEATRLFPSARLLRWDRDVTKARGAHDHILASFLAREADILIGTQMVAKGLDMPGVTLVGVVNADTALHLPDFRVGERTFQLLTQVSGRAGRGERPGRVIIQTYTPDHYAIDAASRYDYDGFVATELESRHRLGYPPFGRLLLLTLAHPNQSWARHEAQRMHRSLTHRRTQLGANVDIGGPSPAYVPRIRGRWRWRIIVRGEDPADLVRDLPLPQHWSIDVDPASLT